MTREGQGDNCQNKDLRLEDDFFDQLKQEVLTENVLDQPFMDSFMDYDEIKRQLENLIEKRRSGMIT